MVEYIIVVLSLLTRSWDRGIEVATKQLQIEYVASSRCCWLKLKKKCPMLVGVVHWLCPPACVGMV